MTDNEVRIKLICERWAAGIISSVAAISEVRTLLDDVGAKEIVDLPEAKLARVRERVREIANSDAVDGMAGDALLEAIDG